MRTRQSTTVSYNRPAHRIERALMVLLEYGLFVGEEEITGGRPAERWFGR